MVKNLPAMLRSRLHPWVKNIPRKKEWQPTPVFLSGESNGQKRLMGYSQSMGRKRVGHVWVTSAFIFTLNKHNVFIVFVFISQVITTMQMLTKEQQIRVLPLGTLWNVFPCIYLAADSWLIKKVDLGIGNGDFYLLLSQYWWKWSAWQSQKDRAGPWVACGSSPGINRKSETSPHGVFLVVILSW